MTSPLIKGGKVSLVSKLATNNLKSLYQDKYGIDTERFFTEIEHVDIYKCDSTGYMFAYPYYTAGDGPFYEALQQFDWYYTIDKWEHLESLKEVNKGDKVLEVGCAKGAFVSRLKENGAEVTGLELNEKAGAEARSQGLDVRNELVQAHAGQNEGVYDIVCSYQVVEHIAEVGEVIEAMIRCLKPGGKLIISVPNNETYIPLEDLNTPPHHVGFWTTPAFQALVKHFNVKLADIKYEPLQEQHYDWYYDLKIRKRLNSWGFIGYKLLALIYPIRKTLLGAFSSSIKGHSIMAVYTKS